MRPFSRYLQLLLFICIFLEKLWVDNLLLSLIGACCSSMFNLLLQFGIELTYPESITVMVGLNGLIQQILGVVITQIGNSIKFCKTKWRYTVYGLRQFLAIFVQKIDFIQKLNCCPKNYIFVKKFRFFSKK